MSKDGYYASDRSLRSFEFANPFEEIYYQPSADHPVLFILRKKGNAENVIKKSVELILPGDGSVKTLQLGSGQLAAVGQVEVQTWKPWPPKPLSPHYDWKLALKMQDGGFVETTEEFAFEAPETGYSQSYDIDMRASSGDWRVSAEKTLYFSYGDPPKYGLMKLRTDGNSRYVFIDYVLNPSGSRNLEFDPKKQIKPQ